MQDLGASNGHDPSISLVGGAAKWMILKSMLWCSSHFFNHQNLWCPFSFPIFMRPGFKSYVIACINLEKRKRKDTEKKKKLKSNRNPKSFFLSFLFFLNSCVDILLDSHASLHVNIVHLYICQGYSSLIAKRKKKEEINEYLRHSPISFFLLVL